MTDKSSSPSATRDALDDAEAIAFNAWWATQGMTSDSLKFAAWNGWLARCTRSETAPMPAPAEREAELKLGDLLENIIRVRAGLIGDFPLMSMKADEMARLAAEALLVLGDFTPSATPQKIKAVKVTVTIPEGWRLVPFEPTWEMLGARAVPGVLEGSDIALVWKAMLDVAPKLLAIKELEYVADFAE